MEVLTNLVRNVIVIILLTTFLDMLLPSSSMQRFVKVVMGLFILVSVLTPILDIFTAEENFSTFNWYQAEQDEGYVTVLQDSNRLSAINQELLAQNYAVRLEKQMEAIVNLVPGVPVAKITVQLDPEKPISSLEGISSVQVMVLKEKATATPPGPTNIKPIQIELASEARQEPGKERAALSAAEKKTAEAIKNTISQYFSLELQQIKVAFQ